MLLLPPPPGSPTQDGQHYSSSAVRLQLRLNCAALGLSLSRCPYGDAAEARRAFAAGSVVGYMWGVVVSDECLSELCAGRWTARLGGEDYTTPLLQGTWRAVATADGTLLASEQCPMALINHSAEDRQRNVSLDLSAHSAAHHTEQDKWRAFPITATRHIQTGEQLYGNYNWTDKEWKSARSKQRRLAVGSAPLSSSLVLHASSTVYNLEAGLGLLPARFARQERNLEQFLQAHADELARMPYALRTVGKPSTARRPMPTQLAYSSLGVHGLLGVFPCQPHAPAKGMEQRYEQTHRHNVR